MATRHTTYRGRMVVESDTKRNYTYRGRMVEETLAAAGGNVTKAITGNASTAALGTVGVIASLALATVLATGAVGTATQSVTVTLSGVSSTSAVGSVGVTKSGSVALTGNAGTGAVGSVTAVAVGTAALTGNSASSAVGSVTSATSKAITGNTATSAVGTATPGTSQALSGVSSTGAVGSVGFAKSGKVGITGVSGSGAVGSVTAQGGVSALSAGSVSSTFWGVFAPQESGQFTSLTSGAVSGTGTVVLQGYHQTGGIFGAAVITTDGTNAAVVEIRKNNASGELLLDVSTKQPMIETSLIRVSDTQVIYYSVTGTGAKVQLFEWTA